MLCTKNFKAVKFVTPITIADIRKKQDKFVIPQYYRYIYQEEKIYEILKDYK